MSEVQGFPLEVTVMKCKDLKHTEFESNQENPYVCIEYGSSRYSITCKDGNQGFVFQEKFVFTLFQGSREIAISVYNSNSYNEYNFIGRGRVLLQRVISQGYDDTTCPIFNESGKTTGEVCLMLCCPTIMKLQTPTTSYNTQSYTAAGDPNTRTPYYPPGNGSNIMSMNRGLKRPLCFENYVYNEEELGRDWMRRKLTTESEGSHLQSTEVLDIAMDELVDRTSPTALDEDTEMAYGSQLPSHSYSAIWDTICF
ncbi:hypothetical protein V2J09_007501 [Rumex salicifolius]